MLLVFEVPKWLNNILDHPFNYIICTSILFLSIYRIRQIQISLNAAGKNKLVGDNVVAIVLSLIIGSLLVRQPFIGQGLNGIVSAKVLFGAYLLTGITCYLICHFIFKLPQSLQTFTIIFFTFNATFSVYARLSGEDRMETMAWVVAASSGIALLRFRVLSNDKELDGGSISQSEKKPYVDRKGKLKIEDFVS